MLAAAVPDVVSVVEQINSAPALGIQLQIWKMERTPREKQKTPEAVCLHLIRTVAECYCPASGMLSV